MKSIALYGPSYWKRDKLPFSAPILAVVIDVLRATSTMVTAFANGVQRIYPSSDLQNAFSFRDWFPQTKLAGEKGGIRIDGFDFGNSPHEFLDRAPLDFDLVMLTTNGTRAFQSTDQAQEVIAASFLNLRVVIEKVKRWKGDVAYFCAGTGNDFSLEDAIVAGAILNEVDTTHPLVSLYRSTCRDLPRVFRQSKNGAHLVQIGLESDIDLCLEIDRFPILPYYNSHQGIVSCSME